MLGAPGRGQAQCEGLLYEWKQSMRGRCLGSGGLVCVGVCVYERERVCVCVREREREKERESERARK